MLASRSARLAAMLLLALLFGWTVRAHRKGGTSAMPSTPPSETPPLHEPAKSSFPDE